MKIKRNNGVTQITSVPTEPQSSPRVERIKARLAILRGRVQQSKDSMEHYAYYAELAEIHVRIAEAQNSIRHTQDPVSIAELELYQAEQAVILKRTKLHRLIHLRSMAEVKREEEAAARPLKQVVKCTGSTVVVPIEA